MNIHLLAISSDYSSDKTLLAAGHNGALFKTKNGGGSWYQVMDNEIKVTAIVFCKGQNKSSVLVGDQNGFLYRSTDSADNRRQGAKVPDSGAIISIAVAPNFSSDETHFIGTEKRGILGTVDGGTSYVAATKQVPNIKAIGPCLQ